MTLFLTKFRLGDKAVHIRRTRDKRWKVCGFCDGSGEITGAAGRSRSCPECCGRKGGYEYLDLEWLVRETLTIGQIDLRHSKRGGTIEKYMAIETGIGGGSVYDADDLFYNQKDAQQECDRRNAETAPAPKEEGRT